MIDMRSFFDIHQNDKKRHVGLEMKLEWFYNEFVANKKARKRDKLSKLDMKRKVRRYFPGYAKLYRFRNDLAHGNLNNTACSVTETEELRKKAKAIVNKLFGIAQKYECRIQRENNYYDVIKNFCS